jgi:hypothetical protein
MEAKKEEKIGNRQHTIRMAAEKKEKEKWKIEKDQF